MKKQKVLLKTTPKGQFEVNWPLDFHHLCRDMTSGVTGSTVPKFLGTLTVSYEKKNPRRSKRCHFTNVCLFFFFHPGSGRFKTESLKENWCQMGLRRMLKTDLKENSWAIKARKISPFKKLENYLARTRLVRPVIQIHKDSKMVVHGNKGWLKLSWPWNVPNQSVRIKRRCRIYGKFQHFPLSKKNSFRGKYLPIYCILREYKYVVGNVFLWSRS